MFINCPWAGAFAYVLEVIPYQSPLFYSYRVFSFENQNTAAPILSALRFYAFRRKWAGRMVRWSKALDAFAEGSGLIPSTWKTTLWLLFRGSDASSGPYGHCIHVATQTCMKTKHPDAYS